VARKPRENVAGGIYHVFARGDNRELVYRDDVDRRIYLRMLEKVVQAKRWRCLAYCLMANHVHLVLETPHANLSAGMHKLHSSYAHAFNARHHRCGHVFQGRYGAVRVASDEQLRAVLVYVARNPVEAALCDAPAGWPWSSFGPVALGGAVGWLAVDRLLSYLDSEPGKARRRYADLCNLKGA
jgi:putative transposase